MVMRRHFIRLAAAAGGWFTVLLAAAPGAQNPPAAAFDPMARGRDLTRIFMAGALDSLDGAWNAAMGAMMNPRQLDIFYRQVVEQLGSPAQLLDERVTQRESLQIYTRLGNYSKSPMAIETQWTFDPRGKVAGFYIRPAITPAPTRFLEYQTKTALRLPFEGPWWVFWGGRVVAENVHVTTPDQRFAMDLVIRKENASHVGDGKANSDYYAFGQRIVAPGPGIVAAVADTVADHVPGVMNRAQPLGNYVVLDHGNGEFSFLCHFKHGTVAVKRGQKVRAGDVLGQCGNSGNSSEPHLHYHLQTNAEPFKGEGLPAQFLRYTAGGTTVERGEPTQGQFVEAVDALPAAGSKRAGKPAAKGGP